MYSYEIFTILNIFPKKSRGPDWNSSRPDLARGPDFGDRQRKKQPTEKQKDT